jgi:hypothetical protein
VRLPSRDVARSLAVVVHGEQDPQRDVATLVVPRLGGLHTTGTPWEPYVLVDAQGARIEPVSVFLRDLQALGRSAATARSYALDLLRWLRFLVSSA